MENIEYKAYVSSVLSLVRTMVIKFEAVAAVDNQLLERSGHQVSSDRRTWRYYLNMSGEYHQADEKMMVQSLDNGDTILFSKENLEIHLATRRAYASGNYLYNRLVDAYPGQRDLINGILNPIDITTAIAAPDYKILRYNTSLVLWNEDQLVPRLQDWIDSFTYQHFDNEYFYTDNLMLPVSIAALYGLMTPAILSIREEAIGTRYVHEFHIWSRLNSYGDFSKYKASLSNKQIMWLYRNIEWLVKNAGKVYTLDTVVKNILTEQSIPIARFRAMLSTDTQLEDLTPTPSFRRINMNLLSEAATVETKYSAEKIIGLEAPLAKDNPVEQSEYLAELIRIGKHSIHSDVPTKLLESNMEDFTNRHAETLMNVLYHEWVHLTQHNLYVAIIDVTEGSSGTQIRLGVKDAMILWTYLTMKLRGEDTTRIPYIYYQKALKVTPPLIEDLQAYGDDRYLSKEMCQGILNLHPGFTRLISPDAFFAKGLDIYLIQWQHKKLYSQYNDFNKSVRIKNACDAMYESGVASLTDIPLFRDWLISKELNLDNLTHDEMETLAWDIFQRATGWDVNDSSSLRSIQSDLVSLMLDLSSYTIQASIDIDDGNVTVEAMSRIDGAFALDANSMGIDSNAVFLPVQAKGIPVFNTNMTVDNLTAVTETAAIDFQSTLVATLPISIGLTASGCCSPGSADMLPVSLHVLDTN